jgi:hypothetical protein
MKKQAPFFLMLLFPLLTVYGQQADMVRSGDAWVGYEKGTNTWTLGTKQMTQILQFSDGNYYLRKFKNNITGTDFVGTAISDEFRFIMGDKLFTGTRGRYELVSYSTGVLPLPNTAKDINPGIWLEIILQNELFKVKLNYQVFASSPYTPMGMVRKYYTVTNTTSATEELSEISMHLMDIDYRVAGKLRLHYWQGGGAFKNCNHEFVDSLSWASHTFHSDAGANDYRIDDNYSGSSSYHPYFVLQHDSGEGIFFGFNYLGPWSIKFWSDYRFPPEDSVKSWGLLMETRRYYYINSQLEQHRQILKPGESFETPNCFTGIYEGDLDNANEQLQYWQAAYKWDYTREKYLFGGNMWNANWNNHSAMNKTGLHFQQVYDIVNTARRIGYTIAHEDDFWFDERGRGVWEGVDWKPIVDYAGKSGISFKLWMPPNHFAKNTPNDLNQKDLHLVPKTSPGITLWYGYGYCMGSDSAINYLKTFLLNRQKMYGTYINRFDGWVEAPCYSASHNHTPGQPFVAQYRNTLRLLKEVKDENPEMGIEGCNSGGEWANWDKTEFLESQQTSDGGGEDDFYHLSYFWSVPKMMLIDASSDVKENDLPRLRAEMLMQKYLRREKVIDRYMNLYHPKAEHAATLHCFIEKTNADRSKCVISQDASSGNNVVVYPKALQPQLLYSVRFRYGNETYSKSGKELMQSGIAFRDSSATQLVFLNLNDFPGSGGDKIKPTVPVITSIKKAEFCGHEGTAIEWKESKDDRMIAGYRVYRNKKLIDFVAIGTFYFDQTPENSLKAHYKIVAVDADGNTSEKNGERP